MTMEASKGQFKLTRSVEVPMSRDSFPTSASQAMPMLPYRVPNPPETLFVEVGGCCEREKLESLQSVCT